MLKNLKGILVLAILGLLVSVHLIGCGAKAPNPEVTLQEFWAAFKEDNYENARGFLSDDISIDSVEAGIWPGDNEQKSQDEMTNALLDRINLKTQGHTIEGNSAVVKVIVTWPNMELLLGKFLAESMTVAFQAAFSGASEEEIDLLLKPIFFDTLKATPDIDTSHEVQLTLLDGNWKISTHPFPDPDKVFNIPNLNGNEQPDGEPPLNLDEIDYDVTIRKPDSIGTVYMDATYTNNTKYPVTGFSMTVLLKDKNEKTYLSTYDTVMPGETSPKFNCFGPETQDPDDYVILTLEVDARKEDGKKLSVEYDFKLNEVTWYEY